MFAVFAAALISCNKEDKKSSDPTVAKVDVVMDLSTISTDILNYYNVVYHYVDFEGKEHYDNISGPTKTTFSVNKPNLGYETSTPFTLGFFLTEKADVPEKAEGPYDANFAIHISINGYYANGELITDSGTYYKYSCNRDDLPNIDQFKTLVNTYNLADKTLGLFFCQTISGEWHIGWEQYKKTSFVQ